LDIGQLGGKQESIRSRLRRWPRQSAAQAKFDALATEAAVGEIQDLDVGPLVVLDACKRGVGRFSLVVVLVTKPNNACLAQPLI
jgi:hypothetical protein